MAELFSALGVFIAFHIIPALGPVRRGLVSVLGKPMYIVSYSILSIAILVWVGLAYANANSDILWPQWAWTRWVPLLTMPLAILFLISSLSEPNPLSVGVKADKFDLDRPGIVSITRHPLTWGLAVWALAHLAPNGDEASLVLFGLFAVLALVGPWSLDQKMRRDLGPDEWQRLSAATSSVPFWAILRGRTRLDVAGIGWRRVVLALLIYGAFLMTHEFFIGVSPLPLWFFMICSYEYIFM